MKTATGIGIVCFTFLNRFPPEQARCHAGHGGNGAKVGTPLHHVGSGSAYRGVEILPMPELEHEQLPEAKRVVALAGQVFFQEPTDERAVEVAALACARRVEHLGEQSRQAPAEPNAERNAEPLLAP